MCADYIIFSFVFCRHRDKFTFTMCAYANMPAHMQADFVFAQYTFERILIYVCYKENKMLYWYSVSNFVFRICKGPEWKPGIFVQFTKENGLAREAGLQPGDQILQCNGVSFLNIPFSDVSKMMCVSLCSAENCRCLLKSGSWKKCSLLC